MTNLIASQPIIEPGLIAALFLGDEKSPSEEFKDDRKKHKGDMTEDEEVTEGLEDSFPASDPVSPTRTDKPAGAAD
ncbi:hypothetical protein [Notoacmeibacter sp. MSK16QG-6]|uniref:hypothetical protein n=1 Tax=Notoacmeibacter sp. MSK16QG-6 TaxID=2957982 RepID=UPI0020A16874|nr:hypothetical protein [Notoacmeibacter sp. MSK16QG-6]MCP1200337.1 hypothetical protein [Notoacmeibacter sp. MSK16QG-6]